MRWTRVGVIDMMVSSRPSWVAVCTDRARVKHTGIIAAKKIKKKARHIQERFEHKGIRSLEEKVVGSSWQKGVGRKREKERKGKRERERVPLYVWHSFLSKEGGRVEKGASNDGGKGVTNLTRSDTALGYPCTKPPKPPMQHKRSRERKRELGVVMVTSNSVAQPLLAPRHQFVFTFSRTPDFTDYLV